MKLIPQGKDQGRHIGQKAIFLLGFLMNEAGTERFSIG